RLAARGLRLAAHHPRIRRRVAAGRLGVDLLHLVLALLAEREGAEEGRPVGGVRDRRLGALHELAVLLLGRRRVELGAGARPGDLAAYPGNGLGVAESLCACT